jgi:large subunit ribosomal protein L6
MSRIGKKAIQIPPKVEVKLTGQKVSVKGPKGTLNWEIPSAIAATVGDGKVTFTIPGKDKSGKISALHGLARAMTNNMIVGVSEGFTKELELVGVGYRAKIEGKKLVLTVGFSHPVEMLIPEGLAAEVGKKQDNVVITGIDKQKVGEWAAVLRRIRPPEPYKGKGIRYKGELIKIKAGKKVSA